MSKNIVERFISMVSSQEQNEEQDEGLIGEVKTEENGKNKNLLISEPRTFDDAQQLADFIKSHRPVIVNTSKMDKEAARRLLDFLSGALYSLEGESQRISDGIFIFTPKSYLVNEEFIEA